MGRRRPAGDRAGALGAGVGAGKAEAVSPEGDAARPGSWAAPGAAAGAPAASLRQNGGWLRGEGSGLGLQCARSPSARPGCAGSAAGSAGRWPILARGMRVVRGA